MSTASKREQVGSILTCPELVKWISVLNCSTSAKWIVWESSHGGARNIKYGQQVNIIERLPLGSPPQVEVMTLAYNHVTNLFISSCSGATVITFGR